MATNIDVAKLELTWDNTSWIKPLNAPHHSLFKRIKNVKITWVSEDFGTVALIHENVNYMYHKGNYYFLRKQDPLDENKKHFVYVIIKDFWMSLAVLRKIKVKGCLIKTNDERILWDNLNYTTAITNNLSGLSRLNVTESTRTVTDKMKDVEILKNTIPIRSRVVTNKNYAKFLKDILSHSVFKVVSSNYLGIMAQLELEEIDSWKTEVINILNDWIDENKYNLEVADVKKNTVTSTIPYLGNKISKNRGLKQIDDSTFKTIKVNNLPGILSGNKEDSYVDTIDFSTLIDIEEVSPITSEIQYSKLTSELFGEEINDLEIRQYSGIGEYFLRPKLYTKTNTPTEKINQIASNLGISLTPNKLEIYWNETEITRLNISLAEYLEDWADGKYILSAISDGIDNRRIGFMPGVFSTEFKESTFRGLYTKSAITSFDFVNGIKLSGKLISSDNQTVENYILGKTPVIVEDVISKAISFGKNPLEHVGEDFTNSIHFNVFSKDHVTESVTSKHIGTNFLKECHDTLKTLRKSLETTVELPINEDQTKSLIPAGTLIVNNLSYGFYKFTTPSSSNNIESFTNKTIKNIGDFTNKVVLITEPQDVSNDEYKNVKDSGSAFGIRYCITNEYHIQTTDLITKFGNNKTSVSIFKKLMELDINVEDSRANVHKKISEYISKMIYGGYSSWEIIKIPVKLTKSLHEWFWTTYYSDAAYPYYTFWKYLAYTYKQQNCRKLVELWPREQNLYILPSQYIDHHWALYMRFPNEVLVIDTNATMAPLFGNIFKSAELTPYENFNSLKDAHDKLKGTHKSKLIYEIYSSELSNLKTQKRNNEYYLEWWVPKPNHISYFDLKGTNYYMVYKHPSDISEKPTIELLLKDNHIVKKHELDDVRFENTIKNSDIIFHINQTNALFIKGKIFPLKTKFDFRTEDELHFNTFFLSAIKSKQSSLFEHYLYKITNKYENLEGNFKIPKKEITVETRDTYEYEKLLLQYEEAAAKRQEQQMLFDEKARRIQVTKDTQQRDYDEYWAAGFFRTLAGLAVSGARAYAGINLAGGILASRGTGPSARYVTTKTDTGTETTPLVGQRYLSGFKLASAVSGISGGLMSLAEYFLQGAILGKNQNIEMKNMVQEQIIKEFQLKNDHKFAEKNEILDISRAINRVNYSEINETNEMEDYLSKIGATDIHLMVIHPKEHEINKIGRIYHKYGVDINIPDFEILLSTLSVEKDQHYILQMDDITTVKGTKNTIDIEYIKETLQSGVKIVYMESLEESFIEVEAIEPDIPDDLPETLVPKVLYDQCIADLAKLSSTHTDEIEKNTKLDEDNKAAVRKIIAERDALQEEKAKLEEQIKALEAKNSSADEGLKKIKAQFEKIKAQLRAINQEFPELEKINISNPQTTKWEDILTHYTAKYKDLHANYSTCLQKTYEEEEKIRNLTFENANLKRTLSETSQVHPSNNQIFNDYVQKINTILIDISETLIKAFKCVNDSYSYIRVWLFGNEDGHQSNNYQYGNTLSFVDTIYKFRDLLNMRDHMNSIVFTITTSGQWLVDGFLRNYSGRARADSSNMMLTYTELYHTGEDTTRIPIALTLSFHSIKIDIDINESDYFGFKFMDLQNSAKILHSTNYGMEPSFFFSNSPASAIYLLSNSRPISIAKHIFKYIDKHNEYIDLCTSFKEWCNKTKYLEENEIHVSWKTNIYHNTIRLNIIGNKCQN